MSRAPAGYYEDAFSTFLVNCERKKMRHRVHSQTTKDWQPTVKIAAAIDGLSPIEAGQLLHELGNLVERRFSQNKAQWRLK